MKKIIRLTENDLMKLVKRVIKEQELAYEIPTSSIGGNIQQRISNAKKMDYQTNPKLSKYINENDLSITKEGEKYFADLGTQKKEITTAFRYFLIIRRLPADDISLGSVGQVLYVFNSKSPDYTIGTMPK